MNSKEVLALRKLTKNLQVAINVETSMKNLSIKLFIRIYMPDGVLADASTRNSLAIV